MSMPRFNAEASLYRTSRQYRVRQTAMPSDGVVAASPRDQSQINVSYQPGAGFGGGELTITGDYFTPDRAVTLKPYFRNFPQPMTTAYTTRSSESPWFPYVLYLGGSFSKTIDNFPCGGEAYVVALEGMNEVARSETINLPCPSLGRVGTDFVPIFRSWLNLRF